LNVKGHNQINISFFAVIVVLEMLFPQTIVPTVSAFSSLFPKNETMAGYEIIMAYAMIFFVFTSGAHFPDLDLNLKHIYPSGTPNYLYHRTLLTHSFIIHLLILISVLILPRQEGSPQEWEKIYVLIYYFELGVFTHLIGDIVTGSIPFLGSKYVSSSIKISSFRIMGSLNWVLYKIFIAFPKLVRYFISPIFLVAFIAANVIDLPIIILSLLFEQKFARIGSKVINPEKFERFWHYLEPWVFAAIVAYLLKVNIVADIWVNYGIFVIIFIVLLSIETKFLGMKISYNSFVETFEVNYNKSYFFAMFVVLGMYYVIYGGFKI